MDLRALFSNPPAKYRSAPFWSWNDKLEPGEVAQQVRQMKEQGMGGFFMHSREGLETEYLGNEWMECVKAAVETAREEGILAWLYDEDRWPSGAAGGLVPGRGDEFRGKVLTFEARADLPQEQDDDLLAVFRGRREGNKLVGLREGGGSLARGEAYLLFRREVSGATPWYNDDTPADNLNPEAVREFIKTTHEAYLAEVGGEFGKTVPGIFSDEPNICHANVRSGRRYVPWTDGLEQDFLEKRGYNFLTVVPYLFLEGEKSAKVRHDFWYTVTERFISAFSKQLGDWCQKHGIALTGHLLEENNLGNAIRLGGAIMPHYCHMQLPGIDLLGEQTGEYLTVKQCTSVANQLGKKRVLSETYGCSGWEFTFEGQKWVGDWQYVLGVNHRCQHLALYSLRGCRKRDYPPSFNYNTTWWQENKVVEGYFARLGAVLSQGKPVRELLVLHPQTTAWSKLGDDNQQEVSAFGEKLNGLAKSFIAQKWDFDFGDELVMAEYGRIKRGKLYVGEAGYRVLLIPYAATILKSTVELISEFLNQGGKVLLYGGAPIAVAAEFEPELEKLWQQRGVARVESQEELFALLQELLPQRVKIKDETGLPVGSLLCMERQLEGKAVYFIVNNNREQGFKVQIQLPQMGKLEEWNPLTGEIKEIPVKKEAGKTFEAEFGPTDSKLYVVHLNEEPVFALAEKLAAVKTLELGPRWRHKRTWPNILPLDFCTWRLEGEEWSAFKPLWQAQFELRERLGMRQVHLNGLQQRYLWVGKPHPQDGAKLELLFNFQVQTLPKNLELVLERAELFEVFLNGKRASQPQGWLLDKAMGRVKLAGVQLGKNQLKLCCRYYHWLELEDCFLAGDFGVDHLSLQLVAEAEELRSGDWCLQGYPFYPGSMIYQGVYGHKLGEQVFLTLAAEAVSAAVRVNGKEAGKIPWRAALPVELTEYLQEGENNLELEVFSSPRNMLGPLHRSLRHDSGTGPESFRTEGADWTDSYVLWPWGLKEAKILVRK